LAAEEGTGRGTESCSATFGTATGVPLEQHVWQIFIALNPKEACQAPRKTKLIDAGVLEWLLSFITLTKGITAQLNPACHSLFFLAWFFLRSFYCPQFERSVPGAPQNEIN
jgi:hypothetical protein